MYDDNPGKAEQNLNFGVQNHSPSNSSNKALIMICTGSVLLVGCIIVIIIYLYFLKRNHNNRRGGVDNNRTESSSSLDDAINRGLEPSILRTLSDFRFSSNKLGVAGAVSDPKECAVCLSEFEEDEIGRILPNCKHSFHLQCIDVWFKFNSNCPLCRTQVQPEILTIKNNRDDDNDDVVVVVGIESGLSSVLNH